MIRTSLKALAIASMALYLNGCAIFDDDEDEVSEVAPIPQFEMQFEPKVNWQTSIGSGVKHYFSRLTPAIYKDTVFVASRDGIVKALDLVTGDEKWQQTLGESASFWEITSNKSARLSGGVTIAYGNVYIGSENGEMFALSSETGELLWHTKVKGEVIAPVAFGEGLIFVHTAAGNIIALHPDNGEQRWIVEQEIPPLSLRGSSAPLFNNGGVIVGSATGKVSAVIASQGVTAWETPIAEAKGATDLARLVDVDTQPKVVGNTLFSIAYNGNLVALEIRSGRVMWKREYASYVDFTYDSSNLYVTDSQGHVFAIDAQTGIEKWSQTGLSNRGVTGPEVVSDYVVVGDNEGVAYLMAKADGKFVSKVELDDSGLFVPAKSAGKQMILYTRDGEVSALSVP
ncbi:outer membrane protein assembly factor BamB [Flocculibacter collagenilyticus]|uniref:outer membrane protein assembly factor BamB n=1 Tax=Flocculibacter collagenilyticus TaxID=2744479 RepID=UPI0022798F92|nr:outer membrane protein assembly factor BamB [Flocculibacter collagenilyticus]